jgi:hypothetical protein
MYCVVKCFYYGKASGTYGYHRVLKGCHHLQCDVIFNSLIIIVTTTVVIDVVVVVVAAVFMLRRSKE